MEPLINILTRTSNRPNYFNQNVKSVSSQTYKNIRHIVSYDNESDLSYLDKYDNIELVKINREKLIEEDTCINPNTGKYSPHNLYFNELFEKINDGWVIILDDDDEFIDENSVKKIVDNIKNDNSLIIWQMKYQNTNRVLPPNNLINSKPMLGQIGSPCFTFNIKNLGDIRFDSWKCGDFRFIQKLYDKISEKIIIPEPLILIKQIGLGNKIDKNG